MSAAVETAPPPARRNRSVRARHEARLVKSRRERRIVDLLNCGRPVAEIAERENVTEKRMRALIREILARRAPQPPAEFLAQQVSRLHEALLVSYSAMSGGNLQAVDRVVKIVRELDRYHGFAAAGHRRLPDAPRREAPLHLPQFEALIADRIRDFRAIAASNPPDLSRHSPADAADIAMLLYGPLEDDATAPLPGREKAAEPLETIGSAPGNGVAPKASRLRTAGSEAGAASPAFDRPAKGARAHEAPPAAGPENAPEPLETIESAPGNGMAPEAPGAQDGAAAAGAPPTFDPAAQDPLVLLEPAMSGPEKAAEGLETVESGPGNGMTRHGSKPPAALPVLCEPLALSPAAPGFRRQHVRMMLNGVAAC
jgi:DNA-binding CsgD family transcriptional regulator